MHVSARLGFLGLDSGAGVVGRHLAQWTDLAWGRGPGGGPSHCVTLLPPPGDPWLCSACFQAPIFGKGTGGLRQGCRVSVLTESGTPEMGGPCPMSQWPRAPRTRLPAAKPLSRQTPTSWGTLTLGKGGRSGYLAGCHPLCPHAPGWHPAAGGWGTDRGGHSVPGECWTPAER